MWRCPFCVRRQALSVSLQVAWSGPVTQPVVAHTSALGPPLQACIRASLAPKRHQNRHNVALLVTLYTMVAKLSLLLLAFLAFSAIAQVEQDIGELKQFAPHLLQ